jgi:hypothetical protein
VIKHAFDLEVIAIPELEFAGKYMELEGSAG